MGAYVSAEDRIKRNIKNIQRNESALDRNFARKWTGVYHCNIILDHFFCYVLFFLWLESIQYYF